MDNLQVFNKECSLTFNDLHSCMKAKKKLEEQEKTLKEKIQKSMEKHNIKSFDSDIIKITYVEESTTESIDLKSLEEKENDLYKELLQDYKKITNKKAYVRFTVK